MTSEGFLEWSLWRHNVSVYREVSWMFCKFSDATNKVTKYITTPSISQHQVYHNTKYITHPLTLEP